MTESPQPIAPHLGPTTATTLRRGSFWVEGTTVETDDGQHLLQGQMFVEWLAPERVSREWPLVLVHGGGGQGTDWLTTPDGRPGWAYRFAAEGYAVYVVDRPGFGRSPFHPDVLGTRGPRPLWKPQQACLPLLTRRATLNGDGIATQGAQN